MIQSPLLGKHMLLRHSMTHTVVTTGEIIRTCASDKIVTVRDKNSRTAEYLRTDGGRYYVERPSLPVSRARRFFRPSVDHVPEG